MVISSNISLRKNLRIPTPSTLRLSYLQAPTPAELGRSPRHHHDAQSVGDGWELVAKLVMCSVFTIAGGRIARGGHLKIHGPEEHRPSEHGRINLT